ncbi:hypothetical protein ACMHYJ_06180 [Castellaniella hirudinis]
MNDSHEVVEEWVSFQIFGGEITMDAAGKKRETSFSLLVSAQPQRSPGC